MGYKQQKLSASAGWDRLTFKHRIVLLGSVAIVLLIAFGAVFYGTSRQLSVVRGLVKVNECRDNAASPQTEDNITLDSANCEIGAGLCIGVATDANGIPTEYTDTYARYRVFGGELDDYRARIAQLDTDTSGGECVGGYEVAQVELYLF